jgi:hypothetical protein
LLMGCAEPNKHRPGVGRATVICALGSALIHLIQERSPES